MNTGGTAPGGGVQPSSGIEGGGQQPSGGIGAGGQHPSGGNGSGGFSVCRTHTAYTMSYPDSTQSERLLSTVLLFGEHGKLCHTYSLGYE
jgi:hypothetical protein